MSRQEEEQYIRENLQAMARDIKACLPKDFGFALLVFSIGEGGSLLYVANVGRTDVLQMMREFIAVNREERAFGQEEYAPELHEEFEQWFEAQARRKGVPVSILTPEMKEWTKDAFNAGRASA